jgi:hypothetical protein
MTRCNLPPGPEAMECEAWAAAQEVISMLPTALCLMFFLSVFVGVIGGFSRLTMRHP